MKTTYPRTRRWTRAEYNRLIETGMFQPGERLELLAGHLVVREPWGDPHTMAVELVNELAAPTARVPVADLMP